jgi:hypothetical protein
MTRYRRNIDCLSEDELHELRETLAAMYQLPASDPNSFARLTITTRTRPRRTIGQVSGSTSRSI